MDTQLLVWRVVGWDARFESRGSLRKWGSREEIAVSTDLEVDDTRRLLDTPGGFIAFAVWNLISRLAATSERRGVLVLNGQPMSDAMANSRDNSNRAGLPVTPLAAVRESVAVVQHTTQKVPELPPRSEIIREFAITSPHPSWNNQPWIRKSTDREFEELHVRYLLHEITRAELDHFLDTHYYDEDAPDNDDWDEEDEDFQTDIPPPK